MFTICSGRVGNECSRTKRFLNFFRGIDHSVRVVQCMMCAIHLQGNVFAKDGVFGGDCRRLLIQLSTDGVNPFGSNEVFYSMWPVMVTILNLPKILRNKHNCVMLAGIIPTNAKHEPKSTDPYLDVLVDEPIELDGRLFLMHFVVKTSSFKFVFTILYSITLA